MKDINPFCGATDTLFWISGHACHVHEKCSLYHFEECNYFYRLQRSCDKVMFLHSSVILFTGGVCHTIPWADTPTPRADTPRADPPADTPLPSACWDTSSLLSACWDTPLPSACWDTVNKRAVRILLECILVWNTLAYRTNILRQNYSVSYQHCLEAEDNKDNVMWCSFHLISCGVFSRRNLCPTNQSMGNFFAVVLLSKESCLQKTPTPPKVLCLHIY